MFYRRKTRLPRRRAFQSRSWSAPPAPKSSKSEQPSWNLTRKKYQRVTSELESVVFLMCHRPGFSTAERCSYQTSVQRCPIPIQPNIGFSIQNHSTVKRPSQIKEEPYTAGYSQVQPSLPKSVPISFRKSVNKKVKQNVSPQKCLKRCPNKARYSHCDICGVTAISDVFHFLYQKSRVVLKNDSCDL